MEVQLAPISANPDVLKLYHKQKTEFHFQQKSDNEFLVFLLDVAVKVISFGKFSNLLIVVEPLNIFPFFPSPFFKLHAACHKSSLIE